MLDISQYDDGIEKQEEGAEIEILGPDGEPTGAKVRVASYDSQRVKAAIRKAANKALLAKNRNPRKAEAVEDREAVTIATVVAAVVSWSGISRGKDALECNEENIRWMIDKFPWFVEQIDKAASDRTLFFGN